MKKYIRSDDWGGMKTERERLRASAPKPSNKFPYSEYMNRFGLLVRYDGDDDDTTYSLEFNSLNDALRAAKSANFGGPVKRSGKRDFYLDEYLGDSDMDVVGIVGDITGNGMYGKTSSFPVIWDLNGRLIWDDLTPVQDYRDIWENIAYYVENR